MFFKSVAILILVTAQNSVISAELNLDDVKSVKNFFDTLALKANSDYKLNYLVRNSENKKVLQLIFEDKQRIFDELVNISTTLKYSSHKSEWANLMRSLAKFEIPGGMYDSYHLHTSEDELDFLRKRIELSIEAFRSVGHLDDEHDVEYFCNKGYPLANMFLEQLHHESVHTSYLNIIGIVRDKMETLMNTKEVDRDHCGQSTSFRKALHDYYQLFMLVNIEFVTLKFFNWATFTRCANIPVKNGVRWVNKEIENSKKMIEYTRRIMNDINHYVYTCEPLDYEREYENIDIELKNMMRPVMIDERNVSLTRKCNHHCDVDLINKARIYENECKEYRDCTYISENHTICSVEEQEKLNKYLFEDINRVIYANNDSLLRDAKLLHAEYEIMNSGCGFCLCTCVSKPSKARPVTAALSFREQVSDIANNKVITAVQFLEKNNMIHIQIMESELMHWGETDLAPWKPLENFIHNEKTEMYYLVHDESVVTLTPGVDYGHPEMMELDDVIAPSGYVVTGVKWGFAKDSQNGSIRLQVRVTPFDFNQGKLIDLNKTHWITSDSQNPKTEMVLERPDNPSESSNNPPDSQTNQFVKFRNTDWCKDFGSRTVPFFNGQTVRFLPMTALGGLGTYHRGKKGYGGYLALRVFDLNLFKFLNSELI